MFSSVAQSCLTLCNTMNRSMPGLPVHHKLPEFTQTDSCNLVLKKGSSSNKSQLGEERKGVREKGRWPHSDTCCLWDTPASRKQFRDEETHHPTKPLSSMCFHHPCINVSLMTSEKLSICSEESPRATISRLGWESHWVRLKRAKTAPGTITSILCFPKVHFMLLHFYEGPT